MPYPQRYIVPRSNKYAQGDDPIAARLVPRKVRHKKPPQGDDPIAARLVRSAVERGTASKEAHTVTISIVYLFR